MEKFGSGMEKKSDPVSEFAKLLFISTLDLFKNLSLKKIIF
jgi:hypothetical protein